MASTKIKFTWAPTPVAKARWHWGLYLLHSRSQEGMPELSGLSRRMQDHFLRKTLYLSIRGILCWVLAFAFISYWAAGFGVLLIQQRNPYNHITYGDIVLPWRWSGIKTLQGKAMLDEAKNDLKAGKFTSGFALLRIGLEKNPTDTEARLAAAQIFSIIRVRDRAEKILLSAFDHGNPGSDYIEQSYKLLREGDNPTVELNFLKTALANHQRFSGTPTEIHIINVKLIRTLLRINQPTAALAIAHDVYPKNSDDFLGVDLAAAISKNDLAHATTVAEHWLQLRPNSEEVLAQTAGVYRLAGQLDKMQTCIDQLRRLNPASPTHAAFDIVQNILAGRDQRAISTLENALFRFGANPSELAIWSKDIAATNRDDFLQRIETHAREHGYDLRNILLSRLLVQIKTRDWLTAQETSLRLKSLIDKSPKDEQHAYSLIISLVNACVDAGSGTQKTFIDTYARNPSSIDFNKIFIDALTSTGRIETAAELINLAEGLYPNSQYLRDASAHTQTILVAKKQAEATARPPQKTSTGKAYADSSAFLADLDALEATSDPESALTLIRQVRLSDPAWLPAINAALSLRELNLALHKDDLPLLQFTLRNSLRSTPGNNVTILELASRWYTAGHQKEALLAVREILKATPDYDPALQTLAQWTPKPAKATLAP